MNYTMKLREKVIEYRLRVETMVAKNLFGFMSGGLTIEGYLSSTRADGKVLKQKKNAFEVLL